MFGVIWGTTDECQSVPFHLIRPSHLKHQIISRKPVELNLVHYALYHRWVATPDHAQLDWSCRKHKITPDHRDPMSGVVRVPVGFRRIMIGAHFSRRHVRDDVVHRQLGVEDVKLGLNPASS